MNLVIAEKPSVARSIATVIGADEKQNGYWQGGGYLVSWCIGHLVSFAEAGRYDEKYCKWKYEDLPILPRPWQFIVPDEKKPQFEVLRALLNRPDVDSVTAATDAGREGELIFRFVYQMAGCTKPVKRLWISSMEDAAIREGFANLRPDSDYDALYQSALCRAKADWLVGTKPICTSFSRIAARVAGVPSPLRSASSGISSAPARSIADRSVSSV